MRGTRSCVLAAAMLAATLSVAAGPALATDTEIFASELAGDPWAATTAYSAQTSKLDLEDVSNNVMATCTSATLSGETMPPIATGATDDAALDVGSGAFSGCTAVLFGAITVTSTTTSPWTGHVSSASSPFTSQLTGVTMTVHGCNYTGNLTTGVTVTNDVTGSSVTLDHAGTLTRTTSGGACAFFPSTAKASGVFTLTSVNGAAVTADNNFFVKQNEVKVRLCRDDKCTDLYAGTPSVDLDAAGTAKLFTLTFPTKEVTTCDTYHQVTPSFGGVGSVPWQMGKLDSFTARTGGTGGTHCTTTSWTGVPKLEVAYTGHWNVVVHALNDIRLTTFEFKINEPVTSNFTCTFSAASVAATWTNVSKMSISGTATLSVAQGNGCPASVTVAVTVLVTSNMGATLYLLSG